jgi:glycosyltransferase involved in cell wall biosynthesis
MLSCSRHCADSLEAVLGISAEVGVLYYGVDVERFVNTDTRAPDRRFGWSHEDRVILYVGRMVEEMGLGVLLDAIPALLRDRRVRIIIAGARGPLASRAESVSDKSGGRVRVLQDVPEHLLIDVYQSADIVATPSINERACLGLAILEAMAAGKPVVACAIGGTPEVLVDGVTGLLVPPGEPAALAGALLRLVNDTILSAALGAAGRARAVERFDVRHTNRAAEELFTSILGSSS